MGYTNIYSISDRELCIASVYLWGVSNCKNIAVVEPGYKSSNITFPEDNPEEEFIRARSSNRGNGVRFYSIVNEYDLKRDLKELINAGLSLSAASKYLAKKNGINKSVIYSLN